MPTLWDKVVSMTTLEKWAREAAKERGYEAKTYVSTREEDFVLGFMVGYQESSKRHHTPPEPCPPGHNCPDCGSSIIQGIYD